MKYHAPTKSILIDTSSLELIALALRCAARNVRELAGLPLGPYKHEGQMGSAQLAECWILDAAKYVGIDLGAERFGQLDLRDPGE